MPSNFKKKNLSIFDLFHLVNGLISFVFNYFVFWGEYVHVIAVTCRGQQGESDILILVLECGKPLKMGAES